MPHNNPTERLTTAQAVVKFLAAQQVERDGATQAFFGGAIGIFGHGNVAGVGQALLQYRREFRLYQARNEQGMVHMATGYAKAKNRLGALACSTSIGPGATNMITGAATATGRGRIEVSGPRGHDGPSGPGADPGVSAARARVGRAPGGSRPSPPAPSPRGSSRRGRAGCGSRCRS